MADNISQTPAASASEPAQSTPATSEKMVPESDVVKAKGGLQKQLEEARNQLSDAHSLRLQAEAKVQTLEETSKKSAEQLKELESLKAATETTKKSLEAATTQVLQYRRTLVSKEYGVPEDTIKAMSGQELDMFEKALKVVKAAQPAGTGYAAGGAGGTSAPTTPLDRALKNLGKMQPGTPNMK